MQCRGALVRLSGRSMDHDQNPTHKDIDMRYSTTLKAVWDDWVTLICVKSGLTTTTTTLFSTKWTVPKLFSDPAQLKKKNRIRLRIVQDENNFIYPFSQVGYGSGRPKINGSDRIRILIPAQNTEWCRGTLMWLTGRSVDHVIRISNTDLRWWYTNVLRFLKQHTGWFRSYFIFIIWIRHWTEFLHNL